MLARQHNPAVDLTEIVVMLGSRLLGPIAGASERERHAMPRYRDAVLKLSRILRMDLGAKGHCAGDALRRRH